MIVCLSVRLMCERGLILDTQRLSLTSQLDRDHAAQAICEVTSNKVLDIGSCMNNMGRNTKIHAMFADIAQQVEFFDRKCDPETVKHLLVDTFARVKAASGELLHGYGTNLPSLIGNDFVHLGIQTRRFTAVQMAEFITYLYAWGVDHGVLFTDSVAAPEWYRDRWGV